MKRIIMTGNHALLVSQGIKTLTLRHPCEHEHDLGKPKYKIGEIVAVTEAYRLPECLNDLSPRWVLASGYSRAYVGYCYDQDHCYDGRKRSAMHMPVEFARCQIKIANVFSAQAYDLTDEQYLAEGGYTQEEYRKVHSKIYGDAAWYWWHWANQFELVNNA